MKLDRPYQHLFQYDVSSIVEQASQINDQQWNHWTHMQVAAARVHGQTMSFPFIWTPSWNVGDDLYVERHNHDHPAWQTVSPLVTQLEQSFNGVCVAAIFANLPAQSRIAEHNDRLDKLVYVHRCHVPIEYPAGVQFTVRGEAVPFEVGNVYEISNVDLHSVINNSDSRRIHLIVDILPWNLISSQIVLNLGTSTPYPTFG